MSRAKGTRGQTHQGRFIGLQGKENTRTEEENISAPGNDCRATPVTVQMCEI